MYGKGRISLRADVSYFLCFTQNRDSCALTSLFRFPSDAKEIGDVCTQARVELSLLLVPNTLLNMPTQYKKFKKNQAN